MIDQADAIEHAKARGRVRLRNGDVMVLHAWYPPTSRSSFRTRAKVERLDGRLCYVKKTAIVALIRDNAQIPT